MNCQEFWDHLPLRGQDITEAQEAHLAECANCTAQWAPHRALTAGLSHMGEEWRKEEAPSRVEAGLMAAFRTQAAFPSRRPVRSRWSPVLAWASAAAATIALATVLVHGFQPSPTHPGTVAAPRHGSQPAVQMASTVSADDDSSLLGEGFVRLPNAPPIGPNEEVRFVTVEMPGSAIIEAGISLSEDRASENVLADVALAADGTPRAVRLVADGGTN